jgi:hypothetical protein
MIMKKIAFLMCAAAVLGTMSSCSSDSEETAQIIQSVGEETRTLVVNANTPSNITFDGKTVANVTTATFENVAQKGILKVVPLSNDYYAQNESLVDFTDKKTIALDIVMAKKPTIEVSQADMLNGQVVFNDQENQEVMGAKASIAVPYNTVISGNTWSPFSITTFMPIDDVVDNVTRANGQYEVTVLTLRCAADGAEFSIPVDVMLEIENSDGFDLEIVSADGKERYAMTEIGGDRRLMKLPHFSDWNVVMKVTEETKITRSDPDPNPEVTTVTVPVKAGANTISYQVKSGALWKSGTKSTLVTNYLKKNYGTYAVTTKKYSYTATAAGTVTLTVSQSWEDKSLTSGKAKFVARIYNKTATVSTTFSPVQQGGHSGGSGR